MAHDGWYTVERTGDPDTRGTLEALSAQEAAQKWARWRDECAEPLYLDGETDVVDVRQGPRSVLVGTFRVRGWVSTHYAADPL